MMTLHIHQWMSFFRFMRAAFPAGGSVRVRFSRFKDLSDQIRAGGSGW